MYPAPRLHRPTRVEIDLAALQRNAVACHRLVSGAATGEGAPPRTLVVVKADAYGHGATLVAPALQAVAEEADIAFFGVALIEEGLELRAAGIALPILVLGGAFGQEGLVDAVREELTPVVFRPEHLRDLSLAAAAAGLEEPFPVHLKIDTGMGRIGLLPEELPAFLDHFADHPRLLLDGVLSHFANADLADDEETEAQFERFARAVDAVREAGHRPRWIHLANSAATLTRTARVAAGGQRVSHTLIRPGLALYGYPPSDQARSAAKLEPVLRWSTRISHLKRVGSGFKVSYGQTWTSRRESLIATLPVGYADGYDRRNSNGAPVLVHGQRCPVIGRVCMDLMMIDVTDVPEAAVGDEVVLLGAQGEGFIGADELAERAGTISYEVLCGVGPRVPRGAK
ncbi:MAG: alanine racemase [Deltaproteobacteria bacterium]|nr:alanine racemase [Deltaproteobacteria bacterium]